MANTHGPGRTIPPGGTNGQFIAADDSAASGAAWSDAVVAGTIFSAKGSLPTASAENTPAELTVGADGDILEADSGQTTGLVWKTRLQVLNNLAAIDAAASRNNLGLTNTYTNYAAGATTTHTAVPGERIFSAATVTSAITVALPSVASQTAITLDTIRTVGIAVAASGSTVAVTGTSGFTDTVAPGTGRSYNTNGTVHYRATT